MDKLFIFIILQSTLLILDINISVLYISFFINVYRNVYLNLLYFCRKYFLFLIYICLYSMNLKHFLILLKMILLNMIFEK